MPENPFGYSLRVRIHGTQNFFGPGIDRLLRLVEQSGSLQTAAAAMEMSYSKAWKIVRNAEAELGFPLMERYVGGAGGGSSQLTPRGLEFLERYEGFSRELEREAETLYQKYFKSGEDDEAD